MQALLEAFGLGLVGGVVPGSVLTILLVSVLQGGYRAGLRAFLWALFAEVTIVLILLTIVFNLPLTETVFAYVGLVGGLVLFYFGTQVLKIKTIDAPTETTTFSALKIYVLSATNAPLYIFWITVCAPLIYQMTEAQSLVVSAALFMTAFEIGWGLATFLVMLAFVKARAYLTNPVVMHRIYLGIAAFMFLLGVRMLYTSATLLLAS